VTQVTPASPAWLLFNINAHAPFVSLHHAITTQLHDLNQSKTLNVAQSTASDCEQREVGGAQGQDENVRDEKNVPWCKTKPREGEKHPLVTQLASSAMLIPDSGKPRQRGRAYAYPGVTLNLRLDS
jgi:hypothetical protein